jgi:DNA-binding transcriptional LysR family regulator
LRIGSSQTTAAARLPELLKDYVVRFNKVDIAVETGFTDEMTARVLDYSLDGAFVTGQPSVTMTSGDHAFARPFPFLAS